MNRDLSKGRIPSIVKYIDSWNDKLGIYFPALVFSYRGDFIKNYCTSTYQLGINESEQLIVLDGQHRIHAMKKYLTECSDDMVKSNFLQNHLTVQIYFCLNIEEEKTLFSDINSHSKKVSAGVITQYDSRDSINVLVRQLNSVSDSSLQTVIDMDKGAIVRPGNVAFCNATRLKRFISLLLYNKQSLDKIQEEYLKCQHDETLDNLTKFFGLFFRTLPSRPGDVGLYVLGYEAVQNAIAKYLHAKVIHLEGTRITWKRNWEEDMLTLVQSVNWSIVNTDWARWMVLKKTTKGQATTHFPHPAVGGLVDYFEMKVGKKSVLV